MTVLVDWERAQRVALKVASRHPQPEHGTIGSAEFESVTCVGEDRVEATTGLRSLQGRAQVQVIGRADWIRANIASLRSLLDPVMGNWADAAHHGRSARVSAVTAQVAGVEIGLMLGWMSARVLGQYDLLYGEADGSSDEGAVYLVGPNMLALEHKFGFPPDEFRLWVTLHELTHRAQFTGVPWMREHFLGLLHGTLSLAEPDPARIVGAVRDAMRDRNAAKQRLHDGGIVAMVATPQQQAMFAQTAGLMSLLEGHGDVVMDRAGTDLIPSAERFSRVLRERRRRASPVARLVQRLIGLEGKLNQYAAGERFIAEIEGVGGERAVDVCWEGPENLPTLDEIRSPRLWLDRVGGERSVA